MRARLGVLLGSIVSPRTAARISGRVPLREIAAADLGARERALPETLGGDGARVLEIPGAVLSRTGTVLDGAFRVVRDACSLSPRVERPWDDARAVGLLPPSWQPSLDVSGAPGVVASLAASTQAFYFHWLFDVLPRIALVRAAGIEPDAWYADVSRPFQVETLERFGLRGDRLLDAAARPTLAPAAAVVPLHRVENGRPVPRWVVDLLRETLGCPAPPTPGRRLWISRTDAVSRQLVNEAEILGRLREHGFEELRLAGLPVAEQARLFAEASVIAAPHGSGLANLAFASPGARVLELLPSRAIDLYRRVADAAGCSYRSVQGASVDGRPSLNGDFRVPVDDVTAALRPLLPTP